MRKFILSIMLGNILWTDILVAVTPNLRRRRIDIENIDQVDRQRNIARNNEDIRSVIIRGRRRGQREVNRSSLNIPRSPIEQRIPIGIDNNQTNAQNTISINEIRLLVNEAINDIRNLRTGIMSDLRLDLTGIKQSIKDIQNNTNYEIRYVPKKKKSFFGKLKRKIKRFFRF